MVLSPKAQIQQSGLNRLFVHLPSVLEVSE